MSELQKVTILVTRENSNSNQKELLLFKHPGDGIRIPAGTVEIEETSLEVAVRETMEKTGLEKFKVVKCIGVTEIVLPEDQYVVLRSTKVYSRPNITSFDWASFRKGIYVSYKRQENDFIQVTYDEYNKISNSDYFTYSITGWVSRDILTKK
ncbi:hypothetical protein BBF96_08985 [Anoxybacter fermentans]|uniref:Nudix hydrolase domain-containing protein n=1 Tax=Anoxybacter fermentans TaxID=1323375 RepID=A0A3Q9HQK5_9FIRM|nr:NUDIX domain-containing protein [Anoxybacter fermentans]AZR73507.1 hypothetical protein BBF96_08985 [Anoxybacter fermentans]